MPIDEPTRAALTHAQRHAQPLMLVHADGTDIVFVDEVTADTVTVRRTGTDLVATVDPSDLGPADCAWWLMCENTADTMRAHPVLGEVPICTRCDAKVERLSQR